MNRLTDWYEHHLHPSEDHWYNRLGQFALSVPNAAEAVPGLAIDVATDIYQDRDSFTQMVGDVFGHSVSRIGQAVSPIPAAVRATEIDKALAGMSWLYNNTASPALSTGLNLQARIASDPSSAFRGDTYSQALDVGKNTSPGQQLFANIQGLGNGNPV